MIQNSTPKLAAVRAEIDAIDRQLLQLIEQRLALAPAIAREKEQSAGRYLYFNPRREMQVIGALRKHAPHLPAGLISVIWRELMGYSLQAQRPMAIVVGGIPLPTLELQVRAQLGSAAAIVLADAHEALRRAATEEALAVIVGSLPPLSPPLVVCDAIIDDHGTVCAWVVGRIASDDCAPQLMQATLPAQAPANAGNGWHPASWRQRKATQLPGYPNQHALAQVEHRLAGAAPLVAVHDILLLRAYLSQVAAGDGFILQGGDCAEAFREFGADKVRGTYQLLLQMGAMLRAASGKEVVHLARIAGQFAKPRSSDTETIGEQTLPSYRGDAVNGPAFEHGARTPDPRRLLEAHRQARATIELLSAYAGASYADLPGLHAELGIALPAQPVSMFTSHEALLLNYEQALTRFDEASESWWSTSGHMVWIGDRTRNLEGAHVEYARGIGNPIGLKCGPSLQPDELKRLIDRLDPLGRPGRLVLIGRFGANKIADHLPQLMRAARSTSRPVVWSIDPMHGNTRSVGRYKTRLITDILQEVRAFFDIATAEGVHPGGVHLEMTGGDVTECLGGSVAVGEDDLPSRYRTHCDPRLNRSQALNVAAVIAEALTSASSELGRGA